MLAPVDAYALEIEHLPEQATHTSFWGGRTPFSSLAPVWVLSMSTLLLLSWGGTFAQTCCHVGVGMAS